MAAPRFVTVIHLTTGHVLASAASGSQAPTLAELVAAPHLRVRVPASTIGGDDGGHVDVPVELLAATRIGVASDDVLDRPRTYVLSSDTPPLEPAPAPKQGEKPKAGVEAVIVWQYEDSSQARKATADEDGTLGDPPRDDATHTLFAWKGGPLVLAAKKPAGAAASSGGGSGESKSS
jgi:hypothetical protein